MNFHLLKYFFPQTRLTTRPPKEFSEEEIALITSLFNEYKEAYGERMEFFFFTHPLWKIKCIIGNLKTLITFTNIGFMFQISWDVLWRDWRSKDQNQELLKRF